MTAAPARSLRISVFADSTAFGVVALAAITIPVTFSTAQLEVFALPKTILAISLASVLAALLLVRWVASGRATELPRSALAAALGAFIVWNVLAAWLAIDPAQALLGERLQYQGLVPTLAYAVFAISAWATVNTARRRRVLLGSVTIGAIAVSMYAVLQRMGLDPIWHYLPYGRVFSTIGQANSLAAYLVVTVPLTLALAVESRWLGRTVGVAVVIVMLCALALTLSRGGYLGLLTVAVIVVGARGSLRGLNIDRGRVGVAVLAALAVIGIVLSIPQLRAVGEQVAARALMTGDLSEGSIRGHFDMWSVGLAIIAEHPVVGTGQDTYALLFSDYRDALLSPERAVLMSYFRPESPHNVHIAIAQGAGLPALIAYVAVITAVVRRILLAMRSTDDRRTSPIAVFLLAAIAGHLVTDTFMTAETAGSVLFWIVLGVGAALSRIPSSSPRSESGRRG